MYGRFKFKNNYLNKGNNDCYLLLAILKVCEVFGYGKNDNADELMLRTLHAETRAGRETDTTKLSGYGIAQFDNPGVIDILDRIQRREDWYNKSKNELGFDFADFNTLEKAKTLLCYSWECSLIFERLTYLAVHKSIPISKEEQADYWFYNYNRANPILRKIRTQHFLKQCDEPEFINDFQNLRILKEMYRGKL